MIKNYLPQRHRGTEKSQDIILLLVMSYGIFAKKAQMKFIHIHADVAGISKFFSGFFSVPLCLCGERFGLKGFGNGNE